MRIIFVPMIFLVMQSFCSSQSPIQKSPARDDSLPPHGYFLDQYDLNPFGQSWTCRFGIPDTCVVTAFVTDTLNQGILDTVYSGVLAPGVYLFHYSDMISKYRYKLGYLHLETRHSRLGWLAKETTFASFLRVDRFYLRLWLDR